MRDAHPPRPVAARDPLRVIELPAPARREIPVPPRPVLALEVPDVQMAEIVSSRPRLDVTLVERDASIPDAGRAETASGPAATADAGDGYVRAVARSILPNWKPPLSLHGVEITVRVHTDAAGHATGLVELVPPTPHADTNRQITYRVRELAYWPARRNGEPVADWAEITFVFCHTGVTATSPASPTPDPANRCASGS
ncbi:MAG: hypothetical protein ACRELC_00060 [Gemmatimonadota bacterium]